MSLKYHYLEHTSDLGMEIYGRDLPELFRNAGFAVFDNILNLEAVKARDTRLIELSAGTIEELFLDWLRELLFRFATDFFVVKEVAAISIEGTKLSAEVKGERFDPQRHRVKIEIKTPTYYMYRIERTPEGYRATVIFDV